MTILVPDAVVIVLPAWKIKTAFAFPAASRTMVPPNDMLELLL
jgi:hypothetical protein